MLLIKCSPGFDKIVLPKVVNETGTIPVYIDVPLQRPVYETALAVIERMPVFLGNEHTLTSETMKAFAERFTNPGIVILDSHFDLGENENARILIDKKIIRPENILLVGTRSALPQEFEFAKRHNLKFYPMKEIIGEGIQTVCDSVMSVAKSFGALYVSIDIDVVDPAFAQPISDPEPAGMTSRELLYFLQRLKLLRNLKAFDLVRLDSNHSATLSLAMKILQEMA